MPHSPSLPHPQPFNLPSKTKSTEFKGKLWVMVSRAMAGLCGQCRHSSPSALVPTGNLVKCLGSIARCHVLHVLARCLARSCSQGQTRELPAHGSHHRALPRQRAATEWRSFGGGAAKPGKRPLGEAGWRLFCGGSGSGHRPLVPSSRAELEAGHGKSLIFRILVHFAGHFAIFCTYLFLCILDVWISMSMSIFVTFGLRLALVGGRVYRWGLQGAAGLALLVVSAGLGSARIEMWIFQKLAPRFFAMQISISSKLLLFLL